MAKNKLARKLWYINDNREVVGEDFLLSDSRSLIILGEAGMGKTTLLEQLKGHEGYTHCTARRLINTKDFSTVMGSNNTLVVDALDEVSAQRDGEAVDLVLRKLDELGRPRFILSCRVADWRSAISIQGIKDLYDHEPLQLHLEPIDREDAKYFLSESMGEVKAALTIDQLEKLGLSGLWNNPQTLDLVKRVASQGKLPTSKGDLFTEATKLLLKEHREEKTKTALSEMADADVLNAAGAAFAALILTGKSALSRLNNVSDEDLDLRDVAKLPFAERIGELLDSRLFSSKGSDLFNYAHRAIGEFLGARWLAMNADTPRKQRRLLKLFGKKSHVPASLRGIHAWLAWHSIELAPKVISSDPMGVVIYGDADKLTIEQAKILLKSLHDLSEKNPRFTNWEQYRVGGLIQKPLLPDIRALLLTRSDTRFRLRLLVLEGLKGSPLASELTDDLVAIMLDKTLYYADRHTAGECLTLMERPLDWSKLVGQLCALGDENSSRLAMDILDNAGYNLFDDEQILSVVLAQLERTEYMVGVFHDLLQKYPLERHDFLIDGVVDHAKKSGDRHSRAYNNTYTDLVYGLLSRRLANNPAITSEKLWLWMQPFSSDVGYEKKSREDVHQFLRENHNLRRAVQSYVLFDEAGDKTIWHRAWRLNERNSGLTVNDDDVVALLGKLEPGDIRWREIVELTHLSHQTDWPKVIRATTKFTNNRPLEQEWLAKYTAPAPIPEWRIKEQKRESAYRAKREKTWAKHRTEFLSNIDKIRAGVYGWVVNPAKAYLNLFNDMHDEEASGPGRLRGWLGDELCAAALQGFEAFLTASPPHPTASQISEGYANSKHWDASYIIVAALAERMSSERGFSDLDNERLMAGYFEIRHSRIDDHAGVAKLDTMLADELRRRNVWEAAQRLYFEPQFEHRRTHIHDLYNLMREERDTELANSLAIDWIRRYREIEDNPETELIDRLLNFAAGQAALKELLPQRRGISSFPDEKRRNWDAVGLIVDFDKTSQSLIHQDNVEPNLLWNIRARLSEDSHRNKPTVVQLEPNQLAWMIRNFRVQYPYVPRPSGMTSGNNNAWDASEFILTLINRLAEDISPKAIIELTSIRDASSDGYSEHLKIVSYEQGRKRFEADWKTPSFNDLCSAITDTPPTNAGQLHAVLIEELKEVQRKITGSDVDWYLDFFKDGHPKIEDDCRDTILKMLRLPFQIQASPEGHLADDKRCDVVCTLNDIMVPIEVKGQWHKDLWTAADQQLDRFYINDWRAEFGIYLVLWFGLNSSKPLTKAPTTQSLPQTAEELLSALKSHFKSTRDERTEVIVLDITRPK